MSTIENKINYYRVLGVTENATAETIKRAYQDKLKQYHPDKIEQTPENKLKYKLVRSAGDILCDVHERKLYDNTRKSEDEDNELDIVRFKKEHDKFIDLLSELKQPTEIIPELVCQNVNDDKIDSDEMSRRLEDFMFQRDNDDIEDLPIDSFENQPFDNNKFNEMFIKCNKKCTNNDELTYVMRNGDEYDNFSNLDDDKSLSNPLEGNFGQINQLIGTNTFSEVNKSFEDILAERKRQDDEIDNMSEFKDVFADNDNISSQFGFMIGKKSEHVQNAEDELLTAYKSIINQ